MKDNIKVIDCNVKDNLFYIKVDQGEQFKAFDCLYINSMFSQDCRFQFLLNDKENTEFINFTINRPSDETILETKIYF